MRKFGHHSDDTDLKKANLDSNETEKGRGMYLVQRDVDPLEDLLKEGGYFQSQSYLSSINKRNYDSFYFIERKSSDSASNPHKIEERINRKINQLDEYLNRMKYMLNEINLGNDSE